MLSELEEVPRNLSNYRSIRAVFVIVRTLSHRERLDCYEELGLSVQEMNTLCKTTLENAIIFMGTLILGDKI